MSSLWRSFRSLRSISLSNAGIKGLNSLPRQFFAESLVNGTRRWLTKTAIATTGFSFLMSVLPNAAYTGMLCKAEGNEGEGDKEQEIETKSSNAHYERKIQQELLLLFADIDKNRDGELDVQEVKDALESNEHFQKILEEACIPKTLALQLLDRDRDGIVRLDDLHSLGELIAEARDETDAPPLLRVQSFLQRNLGFSDLVIDTPPVRNVMGGLGIIAAWSGLWNLADEFLVLKALPVGKFRFLVENGLRVLLGMTLIYFPDGSLSINDISESDEEDRQARLNTALLEKILHFQLTEQEKGVVNNGKTAASTVSVHNLEKRMARIEALLEKLLKKN